MKVIAINGSPHPQGNTFHALKNIGEELKKENIEFEILQVGSQNIHGCMGCNMCFRNKNEKCVITNDSFNELLQKIKDVDGIILGSPVHFSGIAGTMKCFLDRAFYVSGANGNWFRHKVGTAIVAVRRSGGSHTLDGLYHYLTYSEMLIPSSNYWNIIHGLKAGEAIQDAEGNQIMRVLGKNMVWLLKMREQTKNTLAAPETETKIMTNFIR